MRAAWLTDIHLNFLSDEEVADFAAVLGRSQAENILITGDITEGPDILRHFDILSRCGKPIFFVFGNHDFYRSSFAKTRSLGAQVTPRTGSVYLTVSGWRPAGERSFYVGHDGWADGRAGDFMKSGIDLNDYHLILDFAGKSKSDVLQTMRRLADDAAQYIETELAKGFKVRDHGILLTHAPPFREAHLDPQGRPGDDDWSPHFVQQGLGDRLISLMRTMPHKRLLMLCGHTHTATVHSPLENLEVRVGGAVYGAPNIAGTVEIE
ncbi:MAG TPA: metallophosphoesterase [Thermoplasmata archaeon]|nr:metallophosphoesterase [Thermoplasmata archaeon]